MARTQGENIDLPTLEDEQALTRTVLGLVEGTVKREESEEPDPDDYGAVESKAIRHVRTPGGERMYGQPIGSVIVADGAGNPISHAIGDAMGQGHAAVAGIDHTRINGKQRTARWSTDHGYGTQAGVGGFTMTVSPRHDGSWWRVFRRDPKTFREQEIDSGTAKSVDDGKKKALRVVKERIEYLQKRNERLHYNFHDEYPGTYGYDYNADGTEPTEAERTRFEEDPEYRAEKAYEHSAALGLKVWEAKGAGFLSESGQKGDEPFDVNAHETLNSTFAFLEQQFPGLIAQTFEGIGTGDQHYFRQRGGGTTLAYNTITNLTDKKTGIIVNPYLFGDSEDGYQRLANMRGGENGWWSVKNSDIEAEHPDQYYDWQVQMLQTYMHEVGHTFGRVAMGEMRKSNYGQDPDREKEIEDANKRAEEASDHFYESMWVILHNWGITTSDDLNDNLDQFKAAFRMGSMNDSNLGFGFNKALTTEVLSTYGAASFHEMLAEVWSEYMLDPKPREFSTEVGDLLAEVMEMFLG